MGPRGSVGPGKPPGEPPEHHKGHCHGELPGRWELQPHQDLARPEWGPRYSWTHT